MNVKEDVRYTHPHIHTHTHTHTLEYYYSAIKKKTEILPFAITWMDLEGIMLNEARERKNKCHVASLICRI